MEELDKGELSEKDMMSIIDKKIDFLKKHKKEKLEKEYDLKSKTDENIELLGSIGTEIDSLLTTDIPSLYEKIHSHKSKA